MPAFLSDPSRSLILILGFMAIVAGAMAFVKRTRKPAIAFGVLSLALLVLIACDRFAESPREAATRTMQAIALATQTKNPDGVIAHLADSFSYRGMKKAEIRNFLKELEGYPAWAGAVLTDFDRADFESPTADTVRIGFVSRPLNVPSPGYIFYTRATFQKRDADWKMTAIEFRKDNERDGPEIDVATYRR